MKNLANDDKPREKLILKGCSILSDAEILAILLGSGTKSKTVLDLSREILTFVNHDLNALARLSIYDLMKFKGIGYAKAVTITASLELARRKKDLNQAKLQTVKSSVNAFEAVKPYLSDLNHEEFYVINLSRSNKILSIDNISKGGISSTVVDGKIIFKKSLERNASGIILAHNHPSGNLVPSESDILLTKKIKTFGELIELPVLDHLIIADNGYYSFADNGIL